MKVIHKIKVNPHSNELEAVYITPTKLAKWLSCTTRHIYNMVESGLITPRYFGAKKLFLISEIEEYIESTAQEK